MKRIAILLMAMAATLSCAPKAESPALIEKHDVPVVNGQFTPEIMHQMGKVSDPQYCAETGKILYGVTYTSIELNKGNRELFVMNADGTGNHQITRSAGSKSNARWIDGGKRIAYLQKGNLWVADADGKNAHQVSDDSQKFGEFKLSPDGTKILYTSDFKVAPKAADIYPDIPRSTARTITGMMYRHWDHFVENIPHTWLADFDGEKLGEGINYGENCGDIAIIDFVPMEFRLDELIPGQREHLAVQVVDRCCDEDHRADHPPVIGHFLFVHDRSFMVLQIY